MERKKRLKKMWVVLGSFLLILLIYAFWYMKTGLAIPCVFHEVTGLKCPGCGISTFSVLLLKLQWREALLQNYFAPVFYLYLLWVTSQYCICYVKNGNKNVTPKPEVLNWCMLGIVVVWSVARNVLKI